MKKIFLMFAAAALAFVGCKEVEIPGEPLVNSVEISDLSFTGTFPATGGQLTMKVTSSANWALVGGDDAQWAVPQSRFGESGETVTIDILDNTVEQEVTAEFKFVVGNQEAPFTIKMAAYVPGGGPVDDPDYEFELINAADATVALTKDATNLATLLTLGEDLDFRNLYVVVESTSGGDAPTWIKYAGSNQASAETQAFFTVEENTGLLERKAKATFYPTSNVDEPLAPPVVVTFTQAPTLQFEVTLLEGKSLTNDSLVVGLPGGQVSFQVVTNVEYSIAPKLAMLTDWLTPVTGKDPLVSENNTYVYSFDIAELPATPINWRELTLTVSDDEGDFEPVEIIVAQYEFPTATNVVNMTGNWARISYEGNNFEKLNFWKTHSSFTVEFMVKLLSNPTGPWAFFGIEGGFLVRVGDATYYRLRPEVVMRPFWDVTDKTVTMNELKLAPTATMTVGRWTHFAVTFDLQKVSDGEDLTAGTKDDLSNLTVTWYVDGNSTPLATWSSVTNGGYAADKGGPYFSKDFATYVAKETNSIPNDPANPQNAWNTYFNAAYDKQGRNANALFAELRIWNTVLDIPALHAANPERIWGIENPESETNLVAYWKLDEAEGSDFKDSSANGYDIKANTTPAWDKYITKGVTYVKE